MSRIPKGHSLNVDDILERYGNVMEVVEQELHENGVQTTPIPPTLSRDLDGQVKYDNQSGAPLTPEDLTVFDPLTLGRLYAYWTAWANYYETLASAAKAKVEVVENKLEVVKSALECYYREEEGTTADLVRSKVLTDRRFVDWDVELSRSKQFHRGAEAALATFKRTSNNISREQSRRADETRRLLGGGGGSGGPGGGIPSSWGQGGKN